MKRLFSLLLTALLLGAVVTVGQISNPKARAPKMTKNTKPNTEQQSKIKQEQRKQKQSNRITTTEQGSQVRQNSKQKEQNQNERIIRQAIESMVYVRGGSFTMGSDDEHKQEQNPAHKVILTDYFISKYEVTQELWLTVMGWNPSHFNSDPKCPVENVSWNECIVFISKLNQKTGKQFRLPTEAEWEFAARGGNNSNDYKYSGSNVLSDVAWCYDNSGSRTHPVGKKLPNELGLYDMSGNVYEWCQDWYGRYNSGTLTNPQNVPSSSIHVYRGGGWLDYGECDVSHRNAMLPSSWGSRIGFRLAATTL